VGLEEGEDLTCLRGSPNIKKEREWLLPFGEKVPGKVSGGGFCFLPPPQLRGERDFFRCAGEKGTRMLLQGMGRNFCEWGGGGKEKTRFLCKGGEEKTSAD